MKMAAAGLLLMLTACASPINVIAIHRLQIELKCETLVEGCSPQAMADKAQEHCRHYGQNAAQGGLATSPSGNGWIRFSEYVS